MRRLSAYRTFYTGDKISWLNNDKKRCRGTIRRVTYTRAFTKLLIAFYIVNSYSKKEKITGNFFTKPQHNDRLKAVRFVYFDDLDSSQLGYPLYLGKR